MSSQRSRASREFDCRGGEERGWKEGIGRRRG